MFLLFRINYYLLNYIKWVTLGIVCRNYEKTIFLSPTLNITIPSLCKCHVVLHGR